jgi:CRISPR-associated protein Cas1
VVVSVVERDDEAPDFLTKEHREKLLTIPTLSVNMNGKQRPLMIAASETSASLARCFAGEQRKLVLPLID